MLSNMATEVLKKGAASRDEVLKIVTDLIQSTTNKDAGKAT